jgi:Ca2+-binding RTX toxin-like protein
VRNVRVRVFTAGALLLATAAALAPALTGSNTVPPTQAGETQQAITANTLKPPACAALTLAQLVTGTGVFSATSGADLAIGRNGADTISGLAGNDCLLGGAGADSLRGGAGTDVCVGGPGTDTFISCETQIQ